MTQEERLKRIERRLDRIESSLDLGKVIVAVLLVLVFLALAPQLLPMIHGLRGTVIGLAALLALVYVGLWIKDRLRKRRLTSGRQ